MDLNSFLKFGFFLDAKNPYLDKKFQFDIDKERYKDAEFADLLEIGTAKLLKSFEKQFLLNKSHLVPLSGGLDSRTILACLLEFTQAHNIQTYTFGSPQTYDFKIGNLIAEKTGTKHSRISLNHYTYSHNGMLTASKRNEYRTHLFHHPPLELFEKYFDGCITWNGFMGGSIVGSGLDENPSKNKEEAFSKFFRINNYVKSVDLTSVDVNNFIKYLDLSEFNDRQLTLDEKINFFNRQKKYNFYHVKLLGRKNLYPFLEKEWTDFMLSVDNQYRKDKILYKQILFNTFPLFKYKTKNNGGLPLYPGTPSIVMRKIKFRFRLLANKYFPNSRYGISPWTNFINFNTRIRHDESFSRIIYECVNDLDERGILKNINGIKIYKDHMKSNNNYADALLVLASLEYHLKAGLDPNQLIK